LASDPCVSHLPFGNGRSYGDTCHNAGGVLLDCRGLSSIIQFERETGRVRAEAGVLLAEILALAVPAGWFLTVTPGTQFVTVGGAIANDVHGKNHHRRGTFGRHVRSFELLRSDGSRRLCSPDDNSEWYRATIGGMGLTGLITWAELQLMPVNSPEIEQETLRFDGLREFFALAKEANARYEYTVAWIDATATGSRTGRGLFMRGNHAGEPSNNPARAPTRALRIPLTPPVSLINRTSARIFNTLYYNLAKRQGARKVHYASFFYPLDAVSNWNLVYGPNGLMQHQSVVPLESAEDAVRAMLREVADAGSGSCLGVLKTFGNVQSPGLLSFPKPGATLALDLPNEKHKTLRLLDRLDRITLEAGGAVNPYKDARMSGACFKASFPGWERFVPFVDPRFSSTFWRRVVPPPRDATQLTT
jgi:FAD/FMN-containing dehydrogenase